MQAKSRGSLKRLLPEVRADESKGTSVLEDVAIEATIRALCIGPFIAHLAREKPRTIKDLYNEFEKYCRSDNDLRRRLEE
jgi:hypothetical protein